MDFQTYERHAAEAARKGESLDPIVVLSYYRTAMRINAAGKFGSNPYKRSYRELRDRVMARAYLPDRKPRTALDAGLLVLEKAQVMGARS